MKIISVCLCVALLNQCANGHNKCVLIDFLEFVANTFQRVSFINLCCKSVAFLFSAESLSKDKKDNVLSTREGKYCDDKV